MNTPPRRRSAGPLLTLAAALAACAIGAGSTLALWSADGDMPLGTITSGTLGIELVGQTEWRETSPDVAAAPRPVDAATFLARPGDTLTASQQFSTRLRGDNLLGVLTVDWEHPPELAVGVSATYSVRDQDGAALVDGIALGDSTTVEALDTDDTGRTDLFTLDVDVVVEGADRVGPGTAPPLADLGTIVVELDQLRNRDEATS